MNHGPGSADLHLHTTASDGTNDVVTRITQAVDRGLEAIAITDHDIVSDELSKATEFRRGVEIVAGVEVRADLFDTKIEILGYFIDPNNEVLCETLSTARRYRMQRNKEMVNRLSKSTTLDLSYKRLQAEVQGNLGRPHMAQKLVDTDIVESIGGAFDKFLGPDGKAYVPMNRLPYQRVLDAIHAAGGVTSLAHPGRIRSERVHQMVDHLVDGGLDGIEVWYPYSESGPDAYAEISVDDALALAEAHDIIPTGGSDCHGEDSGKFRIGDVRSPASTLEKLRTAAERNVENASK